jgi:hypothetical protein
LQYTAAYTCCYPDRYSPPISSIVSGVLTLDSDPRLHSTRPTDLKVAHLPTLFARSAQARCPDSPLTTGSRVRIYGVQGPPKDPLSLLGPEVSIPSQPGEAITAEEASAIFIHTASSLWAQRKSRSSRQGGYRAFFFGSDLAGCAMRPIVHGSSYVGSHLEFTDRGTSDQALLIIKATRPIAILPVYQKHISAQPLVSPDFYSCQKRLKVNKDKLSWLT